MKIYYWILISTLFLHYGCTHFTKDTPSLNENVVLLHGFGRSPFSMWRLNRFLKKAGYTVYNIGYSSIKEDLENIKQKVDQQINDCCAGSPLKTHFVGHSLGGLLIRSYLDEYKVKNLGHVVMIASPNKGTEFVDYYKDKWWFKIFGKVPLSLSSKGSSFLSSLKPPYYTLGVIAGNFNISMQEHILSGPDDGLVRVESTKVKGMTDFILINKTTHGLMRYSTRTALQTIHFLKHGRFNHPNP